MFLVKWKGYQMSPIKKTVVIASSLLTLGLLVAFIKVETDSSKNLQSSPKVVENYNLSKTKTEKTPEKAIPSILKKQEAPAKTTPKNPGNKPVPSAPATTPQKAPVEKATAAVAAEPSGPATSSPAADSANPTLDWFNTQAANDLAQLILNENTVANGGQPNLSISIAAKDVALATTECIWNNSRGSIEHNYIPAPGGQNIAGGHYQVPLTAEGAKTLAQRLFQGYYEEKTGYDYLLQAGYSPEQIVNGGAKVTVAGVTYSAKGQAGTGFERSASGGVVSHYAEIANQVPSHKATKFSVSVVYDLKAGFVSTAADFFCGEVNYVYQMGTDGQMGYVNY